MDLLREPAWQGLGAIAAFLALAAYAWVEMRRRRRPPKAGQPVVRCFPITDDDSEHRLYDEVSRLVRNATSTVYRSGRGFKDENRANLYRQLIHADEEALQNGVKITRIHTGLSVAGSWASSYARLMTEFPNLEIAVDFDDPAFSDLGIIDPLGHQPVVYMLFEAPLSATPDTDRRPSLFLVVENAQSFALSLAQQFAQRAKSLRKLRPDDVHLLAKKYMYFAWGIDMAARNVLREIPDAKPRGRAVLKGWRRDVSAMLAGPADRSTIHWTGDLDDRFDGVAYEVTWWEKTVLDRRERRAYKPVEVDIELSGTTTQAFTYIPLPSSEPGKRSPAGSWINEVIDGALENDVVDLLDELRGLGTTVKHSTDNAGER
ncbi:gamma-glutamylcyclotransferase family protein [Herbidospora mongoliensis]|uniref:gamma-glutamylcyclotransferase family protein n=1 Tax=Herbidospora mongoliensis TaxID=688067 RepID=UPI000835F312|nr:gamma-glutamylcyclotransferase family protein [Herbidospora mongoliensis]